MTMIQKFRIQNYSKQIKIIHIINQTHVGDNPLTQDKNFKKGCLEYIRALNEDGISPLYIDLESWYSWPQFLVPENKEDSFTNIAKDLGNEFLN